MEKTYSIIKHDKYVVLKLGPNHDFNDCKEFVPDTISQIMVHELPLIVDCEMTEFLSKDWIRALIRLQMDLRKLHRSMKLVSLKNQLHAQLKNEGIDTAFTILLLMKDALQELSSIPKKTLDTDFANPFLDATIKVLGAHAQVEVRPGRLSLKQSDDTLSGEISGIIDVVSYKFNGTVVISFPEKTFLKIMSGMLGKEFTEITQAILDSAGEITNMIFDKAKIALNQKGHGIQPALPSVAHGKNHRLPSLRKAPIVVVPFESKAGNFFVEICLFV